MNFKLLTAKLGPLTVRVVDDDDRKTPPDLAVVLCHGFGAPGTDLVSLARELMVIEPRLASRVRFVFPEAPHELPGAPFGGRMWWPIDMEKLQNALAADDPLSFAKETPAGLAEARKALRSCLENLLLSSKIEMRQVIVGGFSQGAMLATDVVLRLDDAPAGLAILSGAPVSEEEWTRLAPRRRGLSVFQSHGAHDPLLPFAGAKYLQQLLVEAGLHVELVPFPGGHGLDEDVLRAFAAFVMNKLNAASSSPSSSSPPSSSLS